ncbi:SpoIIE family protein phosphatase [Kineococcus gynurae]|uniref:SpoIIE family protein phosphatase n=1 Tax=Kineococcus gynurae TaxID=452979 RepID=A0ABV5LQ14_9ACTN
MDRHLFALTEGSLADLMPTVMHGEPGAVLLVGVVDGLVHYANPVAEQLAPGVQLPCLVDDWSRAAQLQAADGSPLDHPELGLATNPLSRIAKGRPVNGERISAARGSDMSNAREALWVIGIPFEEGVTEALVGMALVVLLPVRELHDAAGKRDELRGAAERLHSRAVVASDLSFTISDPNTPDNPLVWVNPAFERVTGYGTEMLGQNCRFLQGPDTDPAGVQRIREALAKGETVTELLLNYRKDGSAFWNEVVISPVRDSTGHITHHVGVQSDVTVRVHAERERDEALAAARSARGRLEFLSGVADTLSAELDPRTAQDLLPSLVVPDLAHWAFATLVDHDGSHRSRGGFVVRAAHSDPALSGSALRFAENASVLTSQSLTVRVLQGRTGPTLLPTIADDALTSGVADEHGRRQLRELGLGSAIVVPLRARGEIIGALTLLSGPHRRPFDDEDLLTAADLGARAGLALENARLYAQQRRSNETLQLAMLSTPRSGSGLEVVTRYVPAGEVAQVGGDWYDAFPLPDGSTVVVIGDVMGHDVSAAAAMGQLRTLVRGIAYDRACSPDEVLRRMDHALEGLGVSSLATVVIMQISPAEGGENVLRWCTAGHLPPLVREADGSVTALQGVGFILGLGLGGVERRQHERILAPGSTVLLYTDGLVERRDEPMDVRLAELREVVTGFDDALPLDELCDEMLRRMLPHGNDDDVAIVGVRTS